MAVAKLYPTRTISNDWTVSGAAAAHDALADDPSDLNDESFIYQKKSGKTCRVGFSGMIANTRTSQLVARVSMRAGFNPPATNDISLELFIGGVSQGTSSMSVANSGLRESYTATWSTSNLTADQVNSAEIEIVGTIDANTSDQRVYAVQLEATYAGADWTEDEDTAASWTENT